MNERDFFASWILAKPLWATANGYYSYGGKMYTRDRLIDRLVIDSCGVAGLRHHVLTSLVDMWIWEHVIDHPWKSENQANKS